MPEKCRLSTLILRELTIFSYFPAPLNWKPGHVPDNGELRNSADTELNTPHLVSEHLEVSRIQFRAVKMPTSVQHFSGIHKTSYVITVDDAVFPFTFMYF